MAFLSFKNIKVAGMSAAVPKITVENKDNTVFAPEVVSKFMTTVGVERFRMADEQTCTSDLALAATQKLMKDLAWDPVEVELLIFMSQCPDYMLPNTACILQDKLGLPKTCMAFDMTLGCSAYVYGLSVAASLMTSGMIKKALFLCGDTSTRTINVTDPSTAMLFGDGATVTALEYDTTAPELQLSMGTDGSGYKAIMKPEGGYRNMFTPQTLENKMGEDGIARNGIHTYLDGMSVFSFGISRAPISVKETLAHFNIAPEQIDYYVFHQANLMMNELVRKKLKLEKEKVPYSLADYGNTSSASILITMISQLRDQLVNGENTLLLCGFGVGLSWGSCIMRTKNMVVPEIIEL